MSQSLLISFSHDPGSGLAEVLAVLSRIFRAIVSIEIGPNIGWNGVTGL